MLVWVGVWKAVSLHAFSDTMWSLSLECGHLVLLVGRTWQDVLLQDDSGRW